MFGINWAIPDVPAYKLHLETYIWMKLFHHAPINTLVMDVLA